MNELHGDPSCLVPEQVDKAAMVHIIFLPLGWGDRPWPFTAFDSTVPRMNNFDPVLRINITLEAGIPFRGDVFCPWRVGWGAYQSMWLDIPRSLAGRR